MVINTRSRVDFPEPLGPITEMCSLGATSRSKESSTTRSPKDLVTPWNCTMGSSLIPVFSA